MEVPAPKAGIVKSMKITEGGTVSEGDLLMQLEVLVDLLLQRHQQRHLLQLRRLRPLLKQLRLQQPRLQRVKRLIVKRWKRRTSLFMQALLYVPSPVNSVLIWRW